MDEHLYTTLSCVCKANIAIRSLPMKRLTVLSLLIILRAGPRSGPPDDETTSSYAAPLRLQNRLHVCRHARRHDRRHDRLHVCLRDRLTLDLLCMLPSAQDRVQPLCDNRVYPCPPFSSDKRRRSQLFKLHFIP